MSKIVCIYSLERDHTTDFLQSLCDHINATLFAVQIGYDVDSEDDTIEEIYNAVEKADTVLFLGHGTSDSLFASGSDETELFGKANVMLLANKRLFLLACNSAEFIKKYKLTNAIGFGKMPTSLDDARHWKNLHKTTIEDFSRDDIDIYNNALVNALCNSISLETIEMTAAASAMKPGLGRTSPLRQAKMFLMPLPMSLAATTTNMMLIMTVAIVSNLPCPNLCFLSLSLEET